ncbi:hypothetical protein AKJ09_00074 [Labilithrix luteola]|uniref:SprT-like domain-containing protein n=1 Tax=Labilithrix luteola TaxID=1391654 RepID=A0A0K1PIR1_9BACT|nr:hypothetical protein [Labilithrix luteola]AKU93342.1 hypothetical protein AKJ09_00006 [Labilithrix luteola]AKU93410.1 hypothetical protein AKJ09_00074 [Labilithrix luteola]
MRPRVWRRFKLGGETWRAFIVSPISEHLRVDGERKIGTCDYNTSCIYISSDLKGPARVSTFLHEVLHACLFVSQAADAYGQDEAIDERIVGALTPALHQFLNQVADLFVEAS